MNHLCCGLLIVVALAGVVPEPARAGILDRAFRMAAGRLVRVGGREAAREGEEVLARRIGTLAVRHGDEALEVVGRNGPGALRFVGGASEPAGCVERLLIRDADPAVPVLIRPGSITEPVVEAFGVPAAQALVTVGSRSARLLAKTAGSGKYARTSRAAELLKAVGHHGDRVLDFVWRNKGALAVTAGLVAFVHNPKPFLDGVRELAGVVVQEAARPVAQIPGAIATQIVRQMDWTLPAVLLAALVVSVGGRLEMVAWRRCFQGQRGDREETDRGREA